MQKICLGKDVLTGTIEDECSEQEEKTFCYIDKMCDYLEVCSCVHGQSGLSVI